MPRSVPLNGFFLYLRDQAASAARSGRGPAPDQGVGANVLRDDLNDNSIFTDDLGDGSLLIDDLAA